MDVNKASSPGNIPKVYDPKSIESQWYQTWIDKGCFEAHSDSGKPPFTIVIPPPNVTAPLHMGHAFNNTIQDIFIRFKRKKGFETLWMPGTDHAGIATQNVVERELRKENLTRHDLGRDAFVERVWKWKDKYGDKIIHQLKMMGCSCDWRRERFTMDAEYSRAVKEVFIRLYRKGWIYQGRYIINWCPRCATALSDEEVNHRNHQGHLWYLKYPVKNSRQFIVVATTRPETMLGDTAVAVNPDDERYREFIGKQIILPLMQREIPVVADAHVDPEFGTGAVKVTPAHDPNDFEIGNRHQLKQINVMNEDGTMSSEAGDFAGMDRFEARKAVVAALKEQGLLVKTETHVHNIGHCQRCDTVVEPYLSRQWFVRMQEMAQKAKAVVVDGRIRLHPAERWNKTYFNWLDNIRDWCISRQLWWGHRIPVYYCRRCSHPVAAQNAPKSCPECGHTGFQQDPDVMDTWFSSWLWPFATLGWPTENKDLEFFYPTQYLVTGPDIIFFWVARMIMSGLEFMGDVPFTDVYLNGIVRDDHGKKMSKSLGNGIDPLDIISKYSADAMRFTLIMLSAEGQDINLSESHFEMGRNFSNKIWNAYRFLAMNLTELPENYRKYEKNYELSDRWILGRLNQTIRAVEERLENFRVHDSLDEVYHFFWNDFCDWYLELIKPRLYNEDAPEEADTARSVAVHVMKTSMELLHPFIPFITEEIWHRLSVNSDDSLVTSPWPNADEKDLGDTSEAEMNFIQNLVGGIRTIRSEMNVPPSIQAEVYYNSDAAGEKRLLRYGHYVKQMARLKTLAKSNGRENLPASAITVVENTEIFMPLQDIIDIEVEKGRLRKEIDRLTGQIGGLEQKLKNEKFLNKAPEKVVQNEQQKLAAFSAKKEKLTRLLANIK